jgi:thioredoxin 1
MASEKIAQVTDATFEQDVIKSDVPTLVDFTAQWCGPCKMLAPILERVADKFDGKVKIVKLDVDGNQKTAQHYRIFSIPTLLLFAGGQVKGQSVGMVKEDRIEELLSKVI